MLRAFEKEKTSMLRSLGPVRALESPRLRYPKKKNYEVTVGFRGERQVAASSVFPNPEDSAHGHILGSCERISSLLYEFSSTISATLQVLYFTSGPGVKPQGS